MLNQTINRIDTLLETLEHHARTGFKNGTEPARAVTEVSRLRTEFALVVSFAANFDALQLIELEADLDRVVDKLERGISTLLEARQVKA